MLLLVHPHTPSPSVVRQVVVVIPEDEQEFCGLIQNGNLALLKIVLKAFNAKPTWVSLAVAIHDSQFDCAQVIIEAGVPTDFPEEGLRAMNGRTPLEYGLSAYARSMQPSVAAAGGGIHHTKNSAARFCKLVLERERAELGERAFSEKHASHLIKYVIPSSVSSGHGRHDTVKLLLEARVDPNTPLLLANGTPSVLLDIRKQYPHSLLTLLSMCVCPFYSCPP